MRILCVLTAIFGMILRAFGDIRGLVAASVIGSLIVLGALAVYCRMKGRHVAWSLLSLIPFVGVLVIVLLSDKRRPGGDSPPPMLRLVPDYLQIHLADRAPDERLTRRPDGSRDTDEVPPLILGEAEIVGRISRDIARRLPNDNGVLAALAPRLIV